MIIGRQRQSTINNTMNAIEDLIEQKFGVSLCKECISLFIKHKQKDDENSGSPAPSESPPANRKKCMLCLDVLSNHFTNSVMERISKSIECYGGFDINVLSNDSPTVAIPAHVVVRAQCILAAIDDDDATSSSSSIGIGLKYKKEASSSSELYAKIKDKFRDNVRQKLMDRCIAKSYPSIDDLEGEGQGQGEGQPDMKSLLQKEESGCMNCHIIIHASKDVTLPTKIMPLPRSTIKRERKRFRGNDPTSKQGGDPKQNEDKRVKQDLEALLKKAQTDTEKDSCKASLLERITLFQSLDAALKNQDRRNELIEWIRQDAQRLDSDPTSSSPCSIHVASWRSAFYLKGRYTKARRDCSQTPFFVPYDKEEETEETKNKMKRLGIASVEEEICPVVAKLACDGISTQNNIRDNMQGAGSNVLYGLAKFHASGREDMDVRMILPSDVLEAEKANVLCGTVSKAVGSGRPFVLEVIDAHRMPSRSGLDKTVLEINKVASKEGIVRLETSCGSGNWVEENERNHVQYGSNPMGVGISGFDFCSASSYRNLQSETEDKVKFYGCLCWSEKTIPDQEYLDGLLGKVSLPLEIHQSTPLRVLHRRSAAVRIRHVLSLKSYRIDNHWFRLSLSTTAGTYVKEFCHGDCGRTDPSLSSLLGCYTNILELDCEGIATA